MGWIFRLFCWIGLHRWDRQDGHCEHCGACDEAYGIHVVCRTRKKYGGPP